MSGRQGVIRGKTPCWMCVRLDGWVSAEDACHQIVVQRATGRDGRCTYCRMLYRYNRQGLWWDSKHGEHGFQRSAWAPLLHHAWPNPPKQLRPAGRWRAKIRNRKA